jgi:hypothetical protein
MYGGESPEVVNFRERETDINGGHVVRDTQCFTFSRPIVNVGPSGYPSLGTFQQKNMNCNFPKVTQ